MSEILFRKLIIALCPSLNRGRIKHPLTLPVKFITKFEKDIKHKRATKKDILPFGSQSKVRIFSRLKVIHGDVT